MAKRRTGGYRRVEMAPRHDRKRTSPVKITDFESTARLQGLGCQVIRAETVHGLGTAHITWRNMPNAIDMQAAEGHLVSMYSRFSHGC